MSIEDEILKLLLEPKHRYKGIAVSALGVPIYFRYRKQSIANTLSRLSRKGLIERSGSDRIMLRPRGIRYAESKSQRFKFFEKPTNVSKNKNLLILFDIPEDRRAERDWFRRQLQEFGYEMVQRSVWVGPGPLPKDFVPYIKEVGLKECIRIFSLKNTTESIL